MMERGSMKGAQAIYETLHRAGIDTLFANPGTSEMALVRALDDAGTVRGVMDCVMTVLLEPQPASAETSITPHAIDAMRAATRRPTIALCPVTSPDAHQRQNSSSQHPGAHPECR